MSLINKFNGNMNIIGKNIQRYRNEKNMSYEKLSAKLELMGISIHKQSLYDIEINKRTIKDYEIFGIAQVLDININDLFQNIENKID